MTQILKTTFLMGGLTGLFMLVGYLFGGQSGMLVALAFASLTNIGMYWFSDSLVIKMQRAVPLENQYPEVRRIVTDLAQREQMPMPALYYVDSSIPNAFATGRSPDHAAVAVTSGIMEILNERELRAVLAHELGHVKNRDMLVSTIAACFAGAISYIAQFAFFFGGGNREEGTNPVVAIVAAILAPFAAMVIQMAISRSREYLADEHSAHLLHDGDALASALTKLDNWKQAAGPIEPSPVEQATSSLMFANMFSARGLSSLFSTHPSTEDRIARLKTFR